MTLAALIERSKTDLEAWKYTSLAEVGNIFKARSKPLSSARRGGRENQFACELPRRKPGSKQHWIPAFAGLTDFLSSLRLLRNTSVFTGEVATGNNDKHSSHSRPTSPQPLSSQREERGFALFLNGVLQQNDALPSGLISGNEADGFRLTLADGQRLETPVELLFLNEPGKKPAETATKLRVALGANSRLTLIERHETVSSDNNAPLAHTFETVIDLGENAELAHGKIVNGRGAFLSFHLSRQNVRLAKNARYDNFALLRGGKLARNEIGVTLAGEEAACALRGAMLLRDGEHADTTTRVVHATPHGASRQNYRAVLGGKARGVFQGKTVVNQGAQKADGHQLCRALLLSGEAEMDARPALEIYADDVKCSHGCSMGALDEDALFYLRSRGIDETQARALLIEAFVGELAGEIQEAALQAIVKDEVDKWLNH